MKHITVFSESIRIVGTIRPPPQPGRRRLWQLSFAPEPPTDAAALLAELARDTARKDQIDRRQIGYIALHLLENPPRINRREHILRIHRLYEAQQRDQRIDCRLLRRDQPRELQAHIFRDLHCAHCFAIVDHLTSLARARIARVSRCREIVAGGVQEGNLPGLPGLPGLFRRSTRGKTLLRALSFNSGSHVCRAKTKPALPA